MLEWWKANAIIFPALSDLACDDLAIPASSASSERVFTHTSLQVTQKRTRLSEENAKTTSLISLNHSRLE